MELIGEHLRNIAKRKPARIHSAIHAFIDEVRQEYGETNAKGVGSFGFYLGQLKTIPIQKLYEIRSEIRQSKAREPRLLFWWKVKYYKQSCK